MERTCPECGDKLIGRADKKYCSDACRNAHNNSLNKDRKNLVRNVNNRLRKNYRILEALNTKDKTKVKKETLLKHGFNFKFYTSQYITKRGDTYNYVYDQGYLPLEGDWFLLVKTEMTL
ncbi:hypothetical protein G5B37_10975 [Rasiella rasia]|uniref:DUF2116 family Zn-ribbon domain-containing protein n=1 Tax=Rasiella rasia TaxID=2744027 RepID=A0A6G6GNB3_9FLAO|nr:hypothetical protein [Rasiella rasia]QIE60066.1 hypothetical protein G5B37_10975 [Rasiella rasia]